MIRKLRKVRHPGLIRTVLGLAVALGLGRAMWAAETPKSAAPSTR